MSDSESDYEDVDIGLTSVLLGFAAKEATLDDLSVNSNHIGGVPIWFQSGNNAVEPPKDLLICKVCSKILHLLAQLSCPLSEKYYDRAIYTFACEDPNCRRKEGSIRAIRGIHKTKEIEERIISEITPVKVEENLVPEAKLGDSLFSSPANANPFASGDLAVSLDSPKPQQNSSSSKKKGFRKRFMQAVSGHYSCKLIDVEEEYLESIDKPLGDNIKIEEMDTQIEELPNDSVSPVPGTNNSGEVTDIKEFESRNDAVFTRFIDIVESNPDQVLRYEVGLKPLLYSSSDSTALALPALEQSHKKRLEIQLMPHLISELETEEMLEDGMEWGTIFVACDIEDTLPPLDANGIGYVEEWVGVQWE